MVYYGKQKFDVNNSENKKEDLQALYDHSHRCRVIVKEDGKSLYILSLERVGEQTSTNYTSEKAAIPSQIHEGPCFLSFFFLFTEVYMSFFMSLSVLLYPLLFPF